MARKLLLYALAAVGLLLLFRTVAAAVFATLTFVWSLITLGISLAVVGLLCYGAYKLFKLARGDDKLASGDEPADRNVSGSESWSLDSVNPESVDTETDRTTQSSEDPIERIREQYARGEISERELERRLERSLADREMDSIDRELQRERL